jgi:hypothetical protein
VLLFSYIPAFQMLFLNDEGLLSRKQYRRTETTIYRPCARVVHLDRQSLCVSVTFLLILKWFHFIQMYLTVGIVQATVNLPVCNIHTTIHLFRHEPLSMILNNYFECLCKRWIANLNKSTEIHTWKHTLYAFRQNLDFRGSRSPRSLICLHTFSNKEIPLHDFNKTL